MTNRKSMFRKDRAEVGIGTLIVFIAMILVAAIAAAVLVNTSGLLQSRALATGKATSDEVASNLKVLEVFGNRSLTTGSLTNVTVYLQLAAGGLPVNVDKVWIHFVDEQGTAELKKGAGPTTSTFIRTFVREEGTANSLLENGEIVKLHWSATLSEREHVSMSINPDQGQQTVVDFYTPNSFGSLKDIPLL